MRTCTESEWRKFLQENAPELYKDMLEGEKRVEVWGRKRIEELEHALSTRPTLTPFELASMFALAGYNANREAMPTSKTKAKWCVEDADALIAEWEKP